MWREEGRSGMWHYRRWRSKQSTAYPCSHLCSMDHVLEQVPIRKTIRSFYTNKSSVLSLWLIFCFGGMLSVANHRAGWLSSSKCVSMFVWVFFVVSSHCSRASVTCGYVFLLCPLVAVNRELQKHLLRQHIHTHTHTLEIIIELLMCASASRLFCEVSFIRQVALFFKCNLSPWYFVSVQCRVLFLTLIYILNAFPVIQSYARQEQHLLSCNSFQCASLHEFISVYQPTCLSLSYTNNFVFQVVLKNKRWIVP